MAGLRSSRSAPSTAPTSARSTGASRRARTVGLGAVGAVLALGVGLFTLPVPGLDSYLTRQVTERVAAQAACPGRPAAQVAVAGGGLLPQLAAGRLSRITVTLPDVAAGGAQHARVVTTLRGVRDLRATAPTAEVIESTITIGYGDLPVPAQAPKTTLSRAEDGRLQMVLVPPKELAAKTRTTVLARLELRDGSIASVPQGLELFGTVIPVEKAKDAVGGTRTIALPTLPDGLTYTAVSVRPDGVHVGLKGTVLTPLSQLPRTVDGRRVSYSVRGNQLGISSTATVPPGVTIPLTIYTRPRISGSTLVLDPTSVDVLGSNRPTSDPIAAIVLSQVDPKSLSRRLPTLPAGVRYTSASVSSAGLAVGVGGESVRAFADLPSPVAGPVTFAEKDGLLSVTTTGAASDAPPEPMTLFATPEVVDNSTLDLTPDSIRLFDTDFDPAVVFAQTGAPLTKYPVQALPAPLQYTAVQATELGLQFTVRGEKVRLTQDLLGASGCG